MKHALGLCWICRIKPSELFVPNCWHDRAADRLAQLTRQMVIAQDGVYACRLLYFGHTSDLPGTGQALSGQAVANYIAKYATKTLTVPGVPDTRIRTAFDLQGLRCSRHYREMITAAWRLGSRQETGEPRFRQWAHMLGYGGHFLTKSRRYSVTFGALRAARTQHRRAQCHPNGERDPWGRPLDESVVLVLSTWTYAGTGYLTAMPDADLAAASAARAREHHDQADTAA